MAFDFGKSISKLVNTNSSLGSAINNVIDATKENKFKEYESFAAYSVEEPSSWEIKKGEDVSFNIKGCSINVPANLDLCMQYKADFAKCADYYTDQFKYKFDLCSTDYDSFVHYFEKMYKEGLLSMLNRSYGLFLALGIFDMDMAGLTDRQLSLYNKAYSIYATIAGVEKEREESLTKTGDFLANTFMSHDGGFLDSVKTNLYSSFVAGMGSMSSEEKAEIWDKFDKNILFEAVRDDYGNVFYTLVRILSEKGLIGETAFDISKESEIIYNNLQNPMFPAEQLLPTCVKLISKNPFVSAYYDVLESKIGKDEEIDELRNYFGV